MSLYARLAAVIAIALLVAAAWWKVDRMFAAAERRGYDRRSAEDKAAAEAQTARMRELQRAAEMRYTVDAQLREEFLNDAEKEITRAAEPLAACPVPDDLRLRLNAAAGCARGDSPTACGPVDALRHPK